jgi:hypothetical protein
MVFCKTEQIVAHIENKYADRESAMTFRQGISGHPLGNRHRTRHLLNQEFMQALLLNFRHEGKRAIEKAPVISQPHTSKYLRRGASEMQFEHSGGVKAMTDEQWRPESKPSAMLEQRAVRAEADLSLPRPDTRG